MFSLIQISDISPLNIRVLVGLFTPNIRFINYPELHMVPIRHYYIGHIKLSKRFNKVLTERKRKLILEFIAYIAVFAFQVRSFNPGKKEPFLFITIVFCLLFIVK